MLLQGELTAESHDVQNTRGKEFERFVFSLPQSNNKHLIVPLFPLSGYMAGYLSTSPTPSDGYLIAPQFCQCPPVILLSTVCPNGKRPSVEPCC